MGRTRRPERLLDKRNRTLPSTRPMGSHGGFRRQRGKQTARANARFVRALPARRLLQLTATVRRSRAQNLHGPFAPRLLVQWTYARRQH
jgi:hypothetical protein